MKSSISYLYSDVIVSIQFQKYIKRTFSLSDKLLFDKNLLNLSIF